MAKITDDTTTFKPIGPIVADIVRRLEIKLLAAKKDAANG